MRDDLFEFFDPAKARPRRGPDVGRAAEGGARPGSAPLTVSALVGQIKSALSEAFPAAVTVVGEISNFKRHTSGHLYFRLKDAGAALDATMYRTSARGLKFKPADGMQVVVEGHVDVYDVQGRLQLYVQRMTPRGMGELELAFRQLCDRLRREGLFDAARKKPLKRFPRAVGVVTSPTGAAVRDIARTLRLRWPAARAYLLPVPVQGDGAAERIAEAVRLLDANARRYEIDAIIVARGGGSLEDLWAFNEEAVARAIFAARTPIISGVGHEVDVTVADLVADVRAATPTAAAELAVPDAAEVRREVAGLAGRLGRSTRDALAVARAALGSVLRSVVFRDPAWRTRTQIQRLDELSHRLTAALRARVLDARRRLAPAGEALAGLHPARQAERAVGRLERVRLRLAWALGGRSKRAGDALGVLSARMEAAHPRHALRLAEQNLAAAARHLESMSHYSVLRRGFSLTRRPNGKILRSAAEVAAGERIETELADGRFTSRVEPDRPDGGTPQPRSTVRQKRKKGQDAGEPTLF